MSIRAFVPFVQQLPDDLLPFQGGRVIPITDSYTLAANTLAADSDSFSRWSTLSSRSARYNSLGMFSRLLVVMMVKTRDVWACNHQSIWLRIRCVVPSSPLVTEQLLDFIHQPDARGILFDDLQVPGNPALRLPQIPVQARGDVQTKQRHVPVLRQHLRRHALPVPGSPANKQSPRHQRLGRIQVEEVRVIQRQPLLEGLGPLIKIVVRLQRRQAGCLPAHHLAGLPDFMRCN